jgi:hypothetical protein
MVMASTTLPETSDKFAATGDALAALLLLSPEDRAHLDDSPHGMLLVEEHTSQLDLPIYGHEPFASYVAALGHIDYLYAMTPEAFVPGPRSIHLVLTVVTR